MPGAVSCTGATGREKISVVCNSRERRKGAVRSLSIGWVSTNLCHRAGVWRHSEGARSNSVGLEIRPDERQCEREASGEGANAAVQQQYTKLLS